MTLWYNAHARTNRAIPVTNSPKLKFHFTLNQDKGTLGDGKSSIPNGIPLHFVYNLNPGSSSPFGVPL